jgi:hypothetical protein
MASKTVFDRTENYRGENFRISLNYWPDARTRGFYASVTKLQDPAHGASISYLITDIRSALVLACDRFSAKRQTEAVNLAEPVIAKLIEDLHPKKYHTAGYVVCFDQRTGNHFIRSRQDEGLQPLGDSPVWTVKQLFSNGRTFLAAIRCNPDEAKPVEIWNTLNSCIYYLKLVKDRPPYYDSIVECEDGAFRSVSNGSVQDRVLEDYSLPACYDEVAQSETSPELLIKSIV